MISPPKNALCILTRYFHPEWVEVLQTFTHFDVYLVIDDQSTVQPTSHGNVHIIQVSDEVCMENNYYKSSSWSNLKDIVAWDRALYYFNHINTDHPHVWFIEDDVFFLSEQTIHTIDNKYLNSDLLCAFHEINETGDVHQGWNHWVNVIHRIGTPWAHSLVSICRLSRRLLQEIDKYLDDRHLMFIEALFNTLAMHRGFTIDHPEEIQNTITYNYQWNRTEVDVSKIYHPFKNIEDHIYLRNRG